MTTDLITRIEDGSEGDEALDLDVIRAHMPGAVVLRADVDEAGKVIPGKAHDYTHWRLTSSLDAALAFTEKMLPGWDWTIHRDGANVSFGPPLRIQWGRAPTPARALLAATLRALRDMGGKHAE